MAPILKEADAAVTTATSAPAAPQSKPANETPTRPQPVALEIPVTVNGARTIDGSDKRVPFSESTQTVLVFPHGAVVRIATPLASGQLVFLTNDKTKKEVVCQVVKSKSTGAAAAYVELQFTEASAGFWGLQMPGGSAVPAGPRPVASAPSAPQAIAPSGPPAAKPQVVPPAAKPTVPSAPTASQPAAVSSQQPPAPTIPATPPVVAAPPVSATPPVSQTSSPVPPQAPTAQEIAAPPQQPVAPPSVSAPPSAQHSTPSLSPLHDYSKQIEALFSKPPAPAAPSIPESPQPPAAPSTDDLKQQAARLQAQLGSLLFTETHPASAVPGGPTASKPSADESKTAAPERKNGSGILSADEDVKIPSWLAPLSQNAEAVISDSPEKEISQDGSTLTGEKTHAVEADATSDAKGAVIGGQLLGESASESSTSGSKKGLLIGVAATLLVSGGVWYFATNHSASTPNTAERVTNSPSTTSSAPAVSSSPVASASTTTTNKATSPSTPASQPVKKAAPTSSAAAPVSETPSGNSTAADSTPENVAPSRPKPALGKVHLAAPVVSHSSDSETDAPALPSVDADTSVAGDPLAAAAAKHNAPNAPLPVGGDVKQARLIRSVPPQYPAIAKAQRLSGKVEIDALVDKNGNVANTKVISGPPLLYGAAVDAVKQWKYSPALLDGEPTAMHLTVTVEFRAQ